ncbi:DUF4384 domain-containing protein [Nitrogeniibacter aestuarii]|uniref:DUF4384 domain-containing protein n=1 Tax=Nitrogeniibacter aestuarii TaxID=2815343 RepID=UPI001D0FC361|nr:DUF4384 domain-containing protein [Nitrogeniibacter aestuarii]
MTTKPLWLLATLTLAACAPLPPKQQDVAAAVAPPQTLPQRNVTNFSDALRCMDKLYISYGVRDVSVVIEDLSDSTRKVAAGTRDMMMSALSDQTRRSRAIEVSAFGQDANNAVAFLSNAKNRTAFNVVPQYNLRGSISQLDEGVLKRQADGGVSVGSTLGAGASTSRQFNVLGLDVAMADTERLTLVPGVVSKNLTTIVKEGDALDAQATFSKIGINFSTSFQRTDGTAQALRNMVELSSVELFGRLLKLPYWQCIGTDAKNPEVREEIEDWFIGMERGGELTAYFQTQLRNRGFYDGPADGRVTPALRQAVATYRNALGMGDTASVDLAFFTVFLEGPFPQPPAVPAQDATPRSQASAGNIALAIEAVPLPAGAGVGFTLSSNAPAYAYCYARTAAGKLQRIFPNRFDADPRIEPGQSLQLPGNQGFKLQPGANGTVPVACFGAPREIYNDIPAALRWGDFQDLNKVADFGEVQRILEAVANGPVAVASRELVPGK